MIVAINRADTGASVTIPSGSYDDLIAGGTSTGGSVPVAARGFRVLRAR